MTDLSDRLRVDVLLEERSGLGLFLVTEDFVAITDVAGTITVPAGFKTDFASIPRIARWLLPQCGRSARAALLHDWLMHKDDKRATVVFNECLKASHSGIIRRWIMVAFVWLWTFSDLH